MRSVLRGLWRVIKWVLFSVIGLLLLLLMAGFYLTATEHGYRQLPKLINAFTDYQIEYQQLSGTFWSEQRWDDLVVTGPGLEMHVKELRLDNATALFSRQVGVHQLVLRDATINLHPQAKQDAPREAKIPDALPDLRLPFDVLLRDIELTRVSIVQDGVSLLEIHDAALDGTWQEGQLTLVGTLESNRADGDVRLESQTYADYPLTLQANVVLLDGDGARYQSFKLLGEGSVLAPLLTLHASGDTQLQASARAQTDLSARQLDAQVDWQDLSAAQGSITSAAGVLTLSGGFDDLSLLLDADFVGKSLPATQLRAQAHLGEQTLRDINLRAQLLGGEVRIEGAAAFAQQPSWQGVLMISEINASQYDDTLDGAINGRLTTHGAMHADGLYADVLVEALSGQWQGQPVSGQGQIAWRGGQINAEDFQLIVAGNALRANGQLGAAQDTLTVDIEAMHLQALNAGLAGEMSGQIMLSGAVADPQITGAIDWRELAYQDAFVSQQGSLSLDGTLNALQLNAALQATGKDLPRSNIDASAFYTPERVRDIDITLTTGAGSAQVNATLDLRPQIVWDAQVRTQNFDPGLFFDGYSGKVDAQLVSKGTFSALGGVNASAQIVSLDGLWLGEKLSGGGTITIANNSLRLDGLALGIGQNQFGLGGAFDGEILDFDVNINGQNLATLYAPLAGTFSAKGHIGGTKNQPEARLEVSAKNIAYQDYRVNTLKGNIDTTLRHDGAFDNALEISGIDAAGQHWDSIRLTTQGVYQNHTLSLTSSGGAINVDMNANGGLRALDAWAGELSTLAIRGEGLNWQLSKPAKVSLAPQAMALNPLCLKDAHSDFCLDVAYAEQATIDYTIGTLSPQSFAHWLPKNITIGTTASGQGKVNIDGAGAISGAADLSFTPGRIRIAPEQGAPINLYLEQAQAKATFSGETADVDMALAFRDAGEFMLDAKISNFSNLNVAGRLRMDVPDVGKFRYLLPQVSELQGRVRGDLRFSGRANDPAIGGQIILDGGKVVIPKYATELNNIRLELSAKQSGQIDINGRVGTPEGALDVGGALNLAPLTLDMNLSGERLLLADAENMRVVASPKFDVRIDPEQGITLNGELVIPEARVSIPDTSSGRSVSKDVVIIGEDKKNVQEKLQQAETPFNASIGVRLGDAVYFSNKDVSIRLLGGITLTMQPRRPMTARGTVSIASGQYRLYGQELNIERGDVVFSGGNIANPYINFLALREVKDVNVGAQVRGSVDALNLTLTSTPIMPDSAILSYLLFGRAPDGGTDADALLQAAGNYAVGGLISDEIAEGTGLDVFELGLSGLEAGKYLGEDIYVGMQSDFFNAITEFIARYQFTDRLRAEATSSGESQAIDFIYEFEKD